MTGVRKCERCSKNVAGEEFEGHRCHPLLTDIQEIGISEFIKLEIDENGDKIFLAKGLNKISYILVYCKHNPPHIRTKHTMKPWRDTGEEVQIEQKIGIDYFFEGHKNLNGDQVYIVIGLNGVMYRYIKCAHFPPHPDTQPTILTERRDPTTTRQNLYFLVFS